LTHSLSDVSWLLGTLQWPWFCWNVLICSRRWSNVYRICFGFCFCIGFCIGSCVSVGVSAVVPFEVSNVAGEGEGEISGERLDFIFLFLEPFGLPLPLFLLATAGDCVSSVGFVVVLVVFIESGLFEFSGEGSGVWTAVVVVVVVVALVLVLLLISAAAAAAAAAGAASVPVSVSVASFGSTNRDMLTGTSNGEVPVEDLTTLDIGSW
jgi:hypothetical protein